MKKILIKITFALAVIGFDARKFISIFLGLPFYLRDYNKLRIQMKSKRDFVFGNFFPILNERSSEGGTMNGHYFHQDLLVASKIFLHKPIRHIDIGSRVDGFVAHVASFRKIEVFDIRSIDSKIDNIIFTQADLTKLPNHLIECCDSLSSLHAIEHFGLGRYGDTIDIDGHLKALNNIHKMLKPCGRFYFAVPIGQNQRIEFNAHRVFSLAYLIPILSKSFSIESFSYVNDADDLVTNPVLSNAAINNTFNCTYGCGIFELIKN